MKTVLLLALLAVFAMTFAFNAETTPSPDAEVVPVMETGPGLSLTLENVADTAVPYRDAEQPDSGDDEVSFRDVEISKALTTNETSTVGRGRGTPI